MADKKIPTVRAAIIKASVEQPVLKSDIPEQLDAQEKSIASGWLEPDLPLGSLGEMVKNSNILPQCIRAYKSNIAGFGIGIKYIDDEQEENPKTKAEWDRLQDIINLLTLEQDTKEIFEDIIEAREKYGIAYCEVIRDMAGNVIQLEFIRDTPTISMSRRLDPYQEYQYYYHGQVVSRKKKFRKFKQEIGGTTVYFKEFGDPRVMDKRSGEYVEGLKREHQANEIMDFPIGTEHYGEIRWIGQILGSDGARRAEHLNNNYFLNGRHVPLLIAIKGGTLSDDSYTKLQDYMNGIRGAAGQHSFLILEAESTDNEFESKQPEIELKDLASILQKDELFQEYIDNNRKRVQSAFNLPDLYVGYTRDFNRATAQAAIEVTEKQVFQPERASLAWVLNNRLLNGYQFKYVEAYFLAPTITNPDDLYKILSVAEKAGGLPPNKAKQVAYDAIGEKSDDYDGDWGDIPLAISNRMAQRENLQDQKEMQEKQMAQAGTVQQGVVEQLDGQIEKAQQNNEPTEVVAVMKEVRRLLVDIRKQGDIDVKTGPES